MTKILPEVSSGAGTVSYGHSDEVWMGYDGFLRELIVANGCNSVLDIGGGANPVLSEEFVRQQSIRYAVFDISSEELDKAPANHTKIVGDIMQPNLTLTDHYDLVFTKMFIEHIPDGMALHKNIFNLLRPGGLAVHFFPTLYALPFAVNRLMPEWFAHRLLAKVNPRDLHRNNKFPAHYSWCHGPTKDSLRRFRKLGYEVVEYRGYFGNSYYKRIPGLKQMHEILTRQLIQYPIPHLTSFARLTLRRPESSV